jgi:hypothetical protein
MRFPLVPLVGMILGCSTGPADAPPQPSATGALAAQPGARRTAVTETTRGERPWIAEDLRIPPGKVRFTGELFAELPFTTRSGAPQRLSPDVLAFLDIPPGQYMGVRVLATRDRVQRIEEPKGLSRFCVARNGKTTFAVGEGNKFFRATAFDAPMTPIGALESEMHGAYLVREEGARRLVDCRRGEVEDFKNVRGYASLLFHSEVVTLVAFQEESRRGCRMRAGSSSAWEDVPRCSYAAPQVDGRVRIFADTPDLQSTRCLFAIDTQGKRHPCVDTAPAPPRPALVEDPVDLRRARFASQSLLVVPGLKALYVMPVTGSRADLKLATAGICNPLLPTSPLFRCSSEDGRTARVIAFDEGGKHKDELTLSIHRGSEEPRFFETAGGALAMSGACDGTLGDAACVRQPTGAWKTIPFAKDLVKALHTLAPQAHLFPTVSGQLFVATGTSEGAFSVGPVELLVYKADTGLVTRVGKVPLWPVGGATATGGLLGAAPHLEAPSFLWRSAATLSAWPIRRQHPAFGTPESCRFDVSLDGSTDASCVSGAVHAAGRFGVVEKKRGELLETYDGGETWSQVPLPEGVDTSDVDCVAIGCRIGPYFRLGWGI